MREFSKVKIGRSFSYKGNTFIKLDTVSAQDQWAVCIFGGDELVQYTPE